VTKKTRLIGSANDIHVIKANSGASGKSCPIWVTSTPLGGVPINVATPPIEAE